MCTAITYYNKSNYFFGRNLDLEYSYNEQICITPRSFQFNFRNKEPIKNHFAIIGMAFIKNNYPLYYDAINEKGVGIAGLNFPKNAHYNKIKPEEDNIASFELIPWILSQCENIRDVKVLLNKTNVTDEAFEETLPPTPLHWLIADKERSIVLEQTKDGLKIFDNPVGVLTNNPPFDFQLFSLNNFMSISCDQAKNNFSKTLKLKGYSRGMGAIGLPGDLSSQSRFVRASFIKMNSAASDKTTENISQFFHILKSVEQQRGCVRLKNNAFEITLYTSCCDLERGIYYYTTYTNHQINAVNMHKTDLNKKDLVAFNLLQGESINFMN